MAEMQTGGEDPTTRPSAKPRLERGFRKRFRDLLALVRPRRLEFGVDLLMKRALDRPADAGQAQALTDVYLFTRRRVARRLEVTGACTLSEAPWSRFVSSTPAFLCDRSLGGLARWLRAAGYEAGEGGIELVAEAAARRRVLLTSDLDLLERHAIRSGDVASVWLPSGLKPVAQLALVLADLGLGLRDPRCMACGGVLEARPKEAVAERIPPRTARWKDDYWTCGSCARLFWRGTHWQHIARALEAAAAGGRAA